MLDPEVSIIVPVYNAEKYIGSMIASVLRQSNPSWELILINDGSQDGSEEIIRQYAEEDKRIHLINQPNSGPSDARNSGMSIARAKWMAFIDADDTVTEDYLANLMKPMRQYADVDLVCAGYFEVNRKFPQGLPLHDFKSENYDTSLDKQQFQKNLFSGVSGVLWAKLFKKSIFMEHQIRFNPKLRISEDLLAVLEYSLHIKKVYIIPNQIYFYNRLHESGLSSGLKTEHYIALKNFTKEVTKYRDVLNFLDLNKILHVRKYNFMLNMLAADAYSRNEFYQTADYLIKNESPIENNVFRHDKIKNFQLHLLRGKKYQTLLYFIRLQQLIRNLIKNVRS